jgi:3-isopropylmalate/(R)-2-methylmalate dehydratase small subunit
MSEARIARIVGRAVPVRGDDIDTDRIIPARFLKAVTFEGLEDHLFEDDPAAGRLLSDPRYRGAAVLIVGRNFGCGSSREHAPQAIARRGIKAVVGESFSEIFFGNAVALGMPCVRVAREEAHDLMAAAEADPSLELTIDLDARLLTTPARRFPFEVPSGVRDAFLTGAWDATGLLRARPEVVEAVAARLPYLSGFYP